jgi:hypothetical protein
MVYQGLATSILGPPQTAVRRVDRQAAEQNNCGDVVMLDPSARRSVRLYALAHTRTDHEPLHDYLPASLTSIPSEPSGFPLAAKLGIPVWSLGQAKSMAPAA